MFIEVCCQKCQKCNTICATTFFYWISRVCKKKRIKYIHQNLRYYETIEQIHFIVVKIESYVWEKNCNIWYNIIAISTTYYLLVVTGNTSVFLFLSISAYASGLVNGRIRCGKRGQFLVHHGCLSELLGPIPHDSLHFSPFYFKGPQTAATEKPPETRGHPGCNDKSKKSL